jgi:hypothetical protein
MNNDSNCSHVWVANSGRGGEPVYRRRSLGRVATMHVMCSRCHARTWFTPEGWDALPLRPGTPTTETGEV